MVLLQRALLLLATAGVSFPSPIPDAKVAVPVPTDNPPSVRAYTPQDKEYYLDADQVAWVRPGVNIKILSVTNFAPGQKPTVEYTLLDDLGQPLDRTGGLTPGVVNVRCVPATWNAATRRYTNLLVAANGTPTRDSTGTFTGDVGRYKYTFALALGQFDATKPATIWMGGRRVTTDIIGKDYWAPPAFFDFVPSTGAPATTFVGTNTAKCNQCHDPIAPHGGNYRDIKTCVMCHNVNNMTGANAHYAADVFFHAIHSGKDSTIGPDVTYPQDIRKCETCHDKTAAGGFSWYTYPTRAACGSCHNDLNFATGANHPAGQALDDNACAECHIPQGNQEWDASIKNAHTVPIESAQLKGVIATIQAVDNVGPGKKPVVTFKLTNKDGSAIDPKFYATSANGSLSVVLGGPSSDYGAGQTGTAQPISENASGATFNGTVATYSMTNAIPANAKGTWAVAIQTRRAVTLNPAPLKGPATLNEPPTANPVFYIAVTGGAPTPRRTVVQLAKCNVCHWQLVNLFSHGNQRVSIEFCVVCHNPSGNDSSRRPADGSQNPAESISFGRMIHRIHTGNELTQDFTIYGFGGNASNFNEVTYPGDRRDCLVCHANTAAYELPVKPGLRDVATPRDYFSPQGPGTSACLGCHDNRDAAAHAYLNTASGIGEACGTCHGTGKDWDVAKVHAQ